MQSKEALVFWNPWWGNEDWKEGVYEREELSAVLPLFKRKEILSICGARRCGKTTLLYLLIDNLIKNGVSPKNILHLNFEDPIFKGIPVYDLYKRYVELMEPEGKVYFFFDEIQEADEWERAVRKLYDGLKGSKITITGSNSSLLKGDYATLLTGRTLFFELYPVSFPNLIATRGIQAAKKADILRADTKIKGLFREYLKYGGFPEVVGEAGTRMKNILLKDYYVSILTRDVLRRYPVRQSRSYEKVAHYLLSNITSPLSAKRVSSLINVNPHTFEEYIGFIEDVYLFFPVNHFSYSLRAQITYPRKIYCIDNGFINAASFKFSEDAGRLLENTVFLSIKRRGKECYYWKGKRECDFVIKEDEKISVIQVSHSLKEEVVRKREVGGLLEAMDEFDIKKGLILTYDEFEEFEIEGKEVEVMPVWYYMTAGIQ